MLSKLAQIVKKIILNLLVMNLMIKPLGKVISPMCHKKLASTNYAINSTKHFLPAKIRKTIANREVCTWVRVCGAGGAGCKLDSSTLNPYANMCG